MSKLFLLVAWIGWQSCQNDSQNVKIFPLHPYSASPTDYDSSQKKSNNYVCKFFFIEGAGTPSQKLSGIVDKFVAGEIRIDSGEFSHYGSFSMYFYRKTRDINVDFREKADGMLSYNLLTDYSSDLLFIYSWKRGKFNGCEYFKNGKSVKTTYDNRIDY